MRRRCPWPWESPEPDRSGLPAIDAGRLYVLPGSASTEGDPMEIKDRNTGRLVDAGVPYLRARGMAGDSLRNNYVRNNRG